MNGLNVTAVLDLMELILCCKIHFSLSMCVLEITDSRGGSAALQNFLRKGSNSQPFSAFHLPFPCFFLFTGLTAWPWLLTDCSLCKVAKKLMSVCPPPPRSLPEPQSLSQHSPRCLFCCSYYCIILLWWWGLSPRTLCMLGIEHPSPLCEPSKTGVWGRRTEEQTWVLQEERSFVCLCLQDSFSSL